MEKITTEKIDENLSEVNINFYCDNCKKELTERSYKKNKGLCAVCIETIN